MNFFKIDFVFTKTGNIKYISHLDLMRLFTRAMRRAEIPLKLTEGFSPHPKFSIKKALKLGVESSHEEATAGVNRLIRPEDFISSLQKQLPDGIAIKDARLS